MHFPAQDDQGFILLGEARRPKQQGLKNRGNGRGENNFVAKIEHVSYCCDTDLSESGTAVEVALGDFSPQV